MTICEGATAAVNLISTLDVSPSEHLPSDSTTLTAVNLTTGRNYFVEKKQD